MRYATISAMGMFSIRLLRLSLKGAPSLFLWRWQSLQSAKKSTANKPHADIVATWSAIPTVITAFPASIHALSNPAESAAPPPAAACGKMEITSHPIDIHVKSLGFYREFWAPRPITICLSIKYIPAAMNVGARMRQNICKRKAFVDQALSCKTIRPIYTAIFMKAPIPSAMRNAQVR